MPGLSGPRSAHCKGFPSAGSGRWRWLPITLRIAAIVVGGYFAAAGLASLAAVALPAAGWLGRADALVLSAMLAFLAYLVIALWLTAERSLVRACVVPSAIAIGAFGLAHLIAPASATGGVLP